MRNRSDPVVFWSAEAGVGRIERVVGGPSGSIEGSALVEQVHIGHRVVALVVLDPLGHFFQLFP